MRDKIILFDLDGTLIDSTQAICEGFYEAFRSFECPAPPKDSITSQIGKTLEEMFANLGVNAEQIPQFIAVYKEYYRKICIDKTRLLPCAKEAILEAYAIAYLGVVTTKTGEYSRLILEHLDVLKYFECVIGREDVICAKPSAEPILKALESMPKLPLSSIIMIGDTPLDILAAENADIKSVGVLSGYSAQEVLRSYTQNICRDSLEAVLWIKNQS